MTFRGMPLGVVRHSTPFRPVAEDDCCVDSFAPPQAVGHADAQPARNSAVESVATALTDLGPTEPDPPNRGVVDTLIEPPPARTNAGGTRGTSVPLGAAARRIYASSAQFVSRR